MYIGDSRLRGNDVNTEGEMQITVMVLPEPIENLAFPWAGSSFL